MAQVFISYSRQDAGVATQLRETLIANKRDVWMDLQNIPPSAKWEREIAEAIAGADAIVCLLSPDYLASPACQKEIDQAVEEHKRIIPVVVRDVNPQQVPSALAALNWIFMRPSDDPQQAIQRLFFALDTDLEFWHTGSRLLLAAQQWGANGRHDSATLRGTELSEAERWLEASVTKRPDPPPLLHEFIAASRRATARRQRTTISLLSTGLIITAALTVLASVFAVRLNVANVALNRANTTLHKQNQDLQASALAGRATLLTQNNQIDQALLVGDYANQLNDNPDTRGALLGALDSSPFLERILQENKQPSNRFAGVQLQFSPDGKTLFFFTEDTVQRWDMTTLTMQASVSSLLNQYQTTNWDDALSPDGTYFVVYDGANALTKWDSATLKPISQFGTVLENTSTHAQTIHNMVFSPDGSLLAVEACLAQDSSYNCTSDGVTVWDMHTLHEISKIQLPFQGEYVNLAFTSDSRHLIVGACAHDPTGICGESVLIRWNVATKSVERSQIIPANWGAIYDLVLSQNGKVIFTAGPDGSCEQNLQANQTDCPGGKLAAFDATTLAQLSGLNDTFANFTNDHLAISPDGEQILYDLASVDNSISPLNNGFQLFSTATLSVETTPFTAFNGARFTDATTALAFSPDSQHFVTADNDGRLFLWRTKPYSPQSLLPGPDLDGTSPAIYSADGSQLITATGNGRIVFWDAHTGVKLGDMSDGLGATPFVSSLALTPDGKSLAVGDSTGYVSLWNLATKQREGAPLFVAVAKDEISPVVEGISFSKDGTKLLASDDSCRVTLWDLATGEMLHDFMQSFPSTSDQGCSRTAAISADGKTIVIGSQPKDPNSLAFKVYVLDTQKALDNSDQAVIKVLMGFDNFIDGAAFSPDGALLAASDDNGTVIVWNTATWQPITTLHIPPASQGFGEFQAYVFRPSFTADGSKLIVGGYNHILIWDTYTHQPYMPLISEIGYFNNVAINPADTQMVVAFLNGMVGVQSLVPGDWQAQACSIAHRNLTTSEWAEQIGTGTDLPYQKICPDVP